MQQRKNHAVNSAEPEIRLYSLTRLQNSAASKRPTPEAKQYLERLWQCPPLRTSRNCRGRPDAEAGNSCYPLPKTTNRARAEVLEAQAFNEWLSNRRLRQEGESYADELGRMTEAVNRRIPQLRYGPAERAGVQRMARDVGAGRNTSESQVYGGLM